MLMCIVPELFLFSVCPVRASFEDLRVRCTHYYAIFVTQQNPCYLYVPSFIEKYANSLRILLQSLKQKGNPTEIEFNSLFIWNFIDRSFNDVANILKPYEIVYSVTLIGIFEIEILPNSC